MCEGGESGPHFQMDLCCPQNGKIPRYRGDAGCQAEVLAGAASGWCSGGGPRCGGATQRFAQSRLVQVPCWAGNLRLGRAELETEWDLDSEPARRFQGDSIWGSTVGQTKR